MTASERFAVVVQPDFLARQTRATPLAAVAELIWNSLDGDAERVSVELVRGDLAKGISRIIVSDDGEGFSRADATVLFRNLGGSWKRVSRRTKRKNRTVHGQEGRGRYKAFALGTTIVWKVCYLAGDKPKAYEITLNESDLNNVSITAERDAPGRAVGVTVEISDVRRDFKSLASVDGFQDLAETFALYLINYRDASISIDGQTVDPHSAMLDQVSLPIAPIKDEAGAAYPAYLDVIEWKSDGRRSLYLCSGAGVPLEQVETPLQFADASYSAYLKSPYIDHLNAEGRLSLGEMIPTLRSAVEHAKEAIRTHFAAKAASRGRNLVDTWKAEKIYPFAGEPKSPVEKAERQVFDIIAVNVQDIAPDLADASAKTRALHLRMLRHAIELGPEELQIILKEVLDLPERKQKELAALLQETTLAAIITAAKTVADRLKFISALEAIVFGGTTKPRLKERTQLHKILAENTWVFGEEYNLWASDRGLKRVLEKHREFLDPDIVIDEPVKIIGKKRGIVDLMLSRTTRRHRANDVEQLVVELKAPNVIIGAAEITQTKRYAMAVAGDERFHSLKGIRWHFWVLSNEYDDYAREDIEGGPDPARQFIYRKQNVTVGIKTWGELIEENRARLQFFQEKLQHTADESAAMRYLQARHSKYLKGVFAEESEAVPEREVTEHSVAD